MNRFTSILLAGLIASASALAISPKAEANTPASYVAEFDSYGYDRNDDGNYERHSRHYRNGDYDRQNDLRNIRDNDRRYDRDNHRRYDRDNYRRYDRDNHRRYDRDNHRRYDRDNNRRYDRDNDRRYDRDRGWERGIPVPVPVPTF
ncbi:MAG: hypothetical protein RMZ41_027110 [Nostoc sp. DedVER02]|uniref:hypothetical protein n=1 Tax=unclassified Nostoc TaxID=2593658 RepID=UPI002AD4479C|nr:MULTISPECIES: hypothetical protein [unclassified Nostoc]MDZ7988338.1 hypothetical protein [Nostoc sp. DedVER02]MDZ8115486.1 hypothetical protein [Nostoc sp. DedVER01b]